MKVSNTPPSEEHMTEEEVRPYVGKPVRITLDDGCVLTGTLYAHGADGHTHYAAISDPGRGESPKVAETIHAAERISLIEEAPEEPAAEEATAFTDDLGLLAARLALGLGLAAHGAQKAFGWFGGPGPEGAAGFMESLGFKPGSRYGPFASYNEIVAGTLIALGFGGPIGPAIVLSQMVVAGATVHVKHGFFVSGGGVELPVVYSAGALALASSGYGALSLDHAFGLNETLRHPILKTLVLAGGLAAGWLVLGMREVSPPAETSAPEGGEPSSP
jgi:putative oxidoreductase